MMIHDSGLLFGSTL